MYEEDSRELVKTSRTVKPKIGTQTVEILDVPPGEYVVQAHHDLNGNKKMDKNFFGFPKEHWGMSRDPKIKTTIPKSLPKWDEVKVNVAEDEDKTKSKSGCVSFGDAIIISKIKSPRD